MWLRQAKFVRRRHPNKHWWWLRPKYWGRIKRRNDNRVFMEKSKYGDLYLWKLKLNKNQKTGSSLWQSVP